jgi:hypothetical protein
VTEVDRPGPLEGVGALPIFRAAEVQGAYRWVEHQLFELTGQWSSTAAVPAVRVHFDQQSLAHAWHADLWADRLPMLDGVDRQALTRPSGPILARLVAALADEGTRGDDASVATDVRRLTALSRVVLPSLVAEYRSHLGRAVAVADQPTMRVLRLVADDEAVAVGVGESLLSAILADPDLAPLADVAGASAFAASLAAIAGGAGLAL